MTSNITNNNLIAKAVSAPKIQTETASVSTVKTEQKPDTFTKTTPQQPKILVSSDDKSTKKSILNGALSLGFCLALFFLPDIIFRKAARKQMKTIEQAKNFTPILKEITSQRQNILPSGKIKTTLENLTEKFKFNEYIIQNNGKAEKRILTKKELLPSGKWITRGTKTYEGENILDTAAIEKNESKYLVKEYIRTKTRNKEYTVRIKRKNKPTVTHQYHVSNNNEPVLRTTENEKEKINTAFLYNNNGCIGIDKQIIPKSKEMPYNVVTIPEEGLRNKKYNLEKDGQQYNTALLNKFLANF